MSDPQSPIREASAQVEAVKETFEVSIQDVWAGHELLGKTSKVGMLSHHLARAFDNFRSSIFLTSVSIFTALMSLLLLIFFVTLVFNINNFLENLGKFQSVSVFLDDAISDPDLVAINKAIDDKKFISQSEYISKQQALEAFGRSLGDGAALLSGLDQDNPLPASIEIQLESYKLDSLAFDRFIGELKGFKGIAEVVYSRGLFQDFAKLFTFLQGAGFTAVLLMLFVTSLIISNTISLTIFSHRDEIRIMKLLGAKPRFIKAPFLLEGIMLGLFSGVIAVVIANIVFQFFASSWPEVLMASQLFPAPIFIATSYQLAIILIGVVVGCLGALIGSRVCATL